jgi:hypothetical protein
MAFLGFCDRFSIITPRGVADRGNLQIIAVWVENNVLESSIAGSVASDVDGQVPPGDLSTDALL